MTSKSINHNRYFNDDDHKYCYGSIDPELVRTVKSAENESCDSACARLAPPLSGKPGYECSTAGLYELNSCAILKEKFKCSTCTAEFTHSGPGLKNEEKQAVARD